MKKVLIILALLLLCACGNKDNTANTETVIPNQKDPWIEITAEQLSKKEISCRYFVLFVYEENHTPCEDFKNTIEKYLKAKDLFFY